MKLFFKIDYTILAQKVLNEKLSSFGLKYNLINTNEVLFLETVSTEQYEAIRKIVNEYGFEIIEDSKNALVQKIKDVIIEMVLQEEGINVKVSTYLSEKLGHSYGYLSNLFSETTYTSIENFVILQKIEHAKQLMVNTDLSLTEIAFKLNYSSVAHLSSQFKNTTGITPSAFQRIIEKRRELVTKNIH